VNGRWIGVGMSLWLLSCATPATEATGEARVLRTAADVEAAPIAKKPKAKAKATPSQIAAREERKVAVQGIVGTLSNFDVRVTLEKRNKEFAKCHEARARSVPALAGSIEFKVHVLRDGNVSNVHVRDSDLGDRVLERCLSEVIGATHFPEPNGGEADVQWNMMLEPAGRAREPEKWEQERIERVVRKHRGALLETCDARGAGLFTVTAYVSRSGRVLAAGVAAKDASSAEQFDCIADELQRTWHMPKPRKGIAKVSFPIRTGA
jgi:hypothetical protein